MPPKSITVPVPDFLPRVHFIHSIIDAHEIVQLDDENYLTWWSGLKLLFSVCDILDIVHGGVDPPAPVEVLKTASRESPEGLYWRQRRYAWSCIYFALQPYDQELYCKDDNDDYDVTTLWSTIREKERSRRNAWNLRRNAWNLRTKLTRIRLEDFEEANIYMFNIDRIIHELEFANSKEGEVGWKMAPDERTFWYLHGLPETWNEWVALTKVLNNDFMYKPEEMFQHIWRYDSILRAKEERAEKERSMNKRCYKCQEMGHVRRNCPR